MMCMKRPQEGRGNWADQKESMNGINNENLNSCTSCNQSMHTGSSIKVCRSAGVGAGQILRGWQFRRDGFAYGLKNNRGLVKFCTRSMKYYWHQLTVTSNQQEWETAWMTSATLVQCIRLLWMHSTHFTFKEMSQGQSMSMFAAEYSQLHYLQCCRLVQEHPLTDLQFCPYSIHGCHHRICLFSKEEVHAWVIFKLS